MAKKKKTNVEFDGPTKGLCNRKINDAEYCQNLRQPQSIYIIKCGDVYGSHAFITPCEECGKTVLKRSGFMVKEEFNEWAKSKWPTIIEHAVRIEQLKHK
jgi:hypothetical protein